MATKKKIKKKELHYFVLSAHLGKQESWYWDEKSARAKAKELTLKTADTHFVAVEICSYEPSVKLNELPNGRWR